MSSMPWSMSMKLAIVIFSTNAAFAQNPLEELEAKLAGRVESASAKKPANEKPSPAGTEELLPPAKTNSPASDDPTPASSLSSPEASAPDERPYLGLTLEKPVGGGLGLQVVHVNDHSPAWKAGFGVGDRILAIGGNAVHDTDAFAAEIAGWAAHQPIPFLVDRRGRQVTIVAVMIPRKLATRTQPPGLPIPEREAASELPNLSWLLPRRSGVESGTAIGMVLAPLSEAFRRQFGIPAYRGASVLEVTPRSPAAEAGLRAGDCLVELDGNTILSDEDVVRWKQDAEAGSLATVVFYRGAQRMSTTLRVPIQGGDPIGGSRPQSQANELSPEMLTPTYVRALQSELDRTRAELQRVQQELRSLQRSR